VASINCPECRKKISNTAKHCPNCGYLISLEEVAKLEAEAKRFESKIAYIGLVIVLLLLIPFVKYQLNNPAPTPTQPKETKTSTMAFIQCKEFVKRQLHSPATANFPLLDYASRKDDINTYSIKSYVDAQNGFGATVRTNYTCKVQFLGGSDSAIKNWTLIDLSLTN